MDHADCYADSDMMRANIGAYRVLVSVVLVASCGGQDRGTSALGTVKWDESADQGETLPASAAVVVAGEQMIWRVTLHGVEIGELAMAVGAPGMMDGHQVSVVRSRVRSTSAGSLFSKVQHDVTTFIDMTTGRPTYHRRELRGSKELSWVEVGLAGDSFTVKYRDNQGNEHEARQTMPAGTATLDSNALLINLRGWTPQPDERITVHVLRETRVWSMQLVAGGHEEVTTTLDRFPAIRLDGISRRLRRDGTVDADVAPRGYTMWVSDDARRLPVLIAATTDVGDVRMELVHHAIQAPAN